MSQAPPSGSRPPRRARLVRSGIRPWALAGAILALTLAAFLATLEAGREQVRRASRQRLVIAEAVLRAAVDRYRYLRGVLALDTEVRDLLADPGAPAAIAAVNAKLEAIARASGVAAIYLMDAHGLTRSASN